jgi:hypothetical protein
LTTSITDFFKPNYTTPSTVSTFSRSTPGSTPTGSPTNQGFKEDLWDLHSDSTQDSTWSQQSTSSQNVRPKPTSAKNYQLQNQEVDNQFDTSEGKTLRSGKVTYSEPIMAKKWAAAAKSAMAKFNIGANPKDPHTMNPTVPKNSTTKKKHR